MYVCQLLSHKLFPLPETDRAMLTQEPSPPRRSKGPSRGKPVLFLHIWLALSFERSIFIFFQSSTEPVLISNLSLNTYGKQDTMPAANVSVGCSHMLMGRRAQPLAAVGLAP